MWVDVDVAIKFAISFVQPIDGEGKFWREINERWRPGAFVNLKEFINSMVKWMGMGGT